MSWFLPQAPHQFSLLLWQCPLEWRPVPGGSWGHPLHGAAAQDTALWPGGHLVWSVVLWPNSIYNEISLYLISWYMHTYSTKAVVIEIGHYITWIAYWAVPEERRQLVLESILLFSVQWIHQWNCWMLPWGWVQRWEAGQTPVWPPCWPGRGRRWRCPWSDRTPGSWSPAPPWSSARPGPGWCPPPLCPHQGRSCYCHQTLCSQKWAPKIARLILFFELSKWLYDIYL